MVTIREIIERRSIVRNPLRPSGVVGGAGRSSASRPNIVSRAVTNVRSFFKRGINPVRPRLADLPIGLGIAAGALAATPIGAVARVGTGIAATGRYAGIKNFLFPPSKLGALRTYGLSVAGLLGIETAFKAGRGVVSGEPIDLLPGRSGILTALGGGLSRPAVLGGIGFQTLASGASAVGTTAREIFHDVYGGTPFIPGGSYQGGDISVSLPSAPMGPAVVGGPTIPGGGFGVTISGGAGGGIDPSMLLLLAGALGLGGYALGRRKRRKKYKRKKRK